MKSRAACMFICALLLAACGGSKAATVTTTTPAKRLSVVATTTQIGDFVNSVAGGLVNLSVIVPVGQPVATYKPTSADVTTLANADVIFRNGLGLDPWLEKAVDSDSAAVTTDVSTGVVTQSRQGKGPNQKTAPDPYIWMSPTNAQIMISNIVKTLSTRDTSHAQAFSDNQRAYGAQIDGAARAARQVLSSVVSPKLVASVDSFGYLASEFDITYVGSVDSIAADQLVTMMKAQKVTAVFVDSVYTTANAQSVATTAGARLISGKDVLYGESLGSKGSDAATYLGMLKHDTDTLASNLG